MVGYNLSVVALIFSYVPFIGQVGLQYWLLNAAYWVAAENSDLVAVIDVATQQVVAQIPVSSRSNGVLVHPDGKRVFVSSGGKGTIQVIDPATNRIVAEVEVGRRPWNMALTPDGRKLYVACGRSNAVAVVDTAGYVKTGEIAVGHLPWGAAIR